MSSSRHKELVLTFKKLNDDARLPFRGDEMAAGYDIASCEDTVIPAGGFKMVGTGLACAFATYEQRDDRSASMFFLDEEIDFVDFCPVHSKALFEIQVRSRSGLAAKKGISVLNAPGTIDANYRGEIKVILANMSNEDFVVEKGDRIAQLVVNRVYTPNIVQVKELNKTDRGTGGFGSTGIK